MKIKNISGENRVMFWLGSKIDFPMEEWVNVPKELGMVLVNQPHFMKLTRKKKEVN